MWCLRCLLHIKEPFLQKEICGSKHSQVWVISAPMEDRTNCTHGHLPVNHLLWAQVCLSLSRLPGVPTGLLESWWKDKETIHYLHINKDSFEAINAGGRGEGTCTMSSRHPQLVRPLSSTSIMALSQCPVYVQTLPNHFSSIFSTY